MTDPAALAREIATCTCDPAYRRKFMLSENEHVRECPASIVSAIETALRTVAAEARREAMEWQPIETAARSWNDRLLTPGICKQVVIGYFDGINSCWLDSDCSEAFHPTHWMPLPPAPAPSLAEKGKPHG
jgi:hypothetical protein